MKTIFNFIKKEHVQSTKDDVSKDINNLNYYQYTKRFGMKQVNKVKHLRIFAIICGILFFSALIIQLVCCIIKSNANNLYYLGICFCFIWVLLLIFITPFCFWINVKKYHKVIYFLMQKQILNPMIKN